MLPGYHETTAVLDKIAGGQLIARRQDTAMNQLFSHILEQLLARAGANCSHERNGSVAPRSPR